MELQSLTVTGAIIKLMLIGPSSGINTISFSVLVVTDYLDYFEVITSSYVPIGQTPSGSLYASNFTVNPTRLVL